jgi:hypothetical protein
MASGISPSRPSFRPCCASPPKAHEGGVTKPGPLQNPATAVAAWARFRRLMRWMFLITLTTVIGAISVLYRQEGMISVHFTSRWRWAWRWRCC